MVSRARIEEDRRTLAARYRAEGHWSDRSLRDLLDEGARRFPDARLVWESEEHPDETTLSEIHARAARVAGALDDLGIGKGDAIACQVPSWLEGLLIYDAALTVGATVVPIIHYYGPAEVSFIVRQSGARMLVMPSRWGKIDYLGRFEQLRDCDELEHVVTIGDASVPGGLTWDALEARGHTDWSPPEIDGDDVCLLLYTSGTTAEPKGVRHSHNTLGAETRNMPVDLWLDDEPVLLQVYPSGHMGGVLGLARAFLRGGTTVFLDSWSADRCAALIEKHGAVGQNSSPYFMRTLIEAVERTGVDTSTNRVMPIGGAHVPPELVAAADRLGWRAARSYGSTEHPTVTASSPDDPIGIRGSTDGYPIGGNEVEIVDEDGVELPVGVEGEVATRGPELFVGYQDELLDLESFLPGGWFLTGDLGFLDDGGCLTLTDRKKDVILRGGETMSSQEIEQVLEAHAAVAEVAVVARPDERLGEHACAFVVLRPGCELSLDEVRSHFTAAGVARQKTPESLEIVEQLPRSPLGKVKKGELRALLSSREVSPR